MAGKQMDAVASFAYLLDNVPKWIDQISTLTAHTEKRYEEFKAEYTRLVHQARPRRIKTQSICSIHTNDNQFEEELDIRSSATPPPPNPVDISPLVAGNRYIYAQANKKRKPGTSFRSGASGPLKFRSKQQVVIYYDNSVQDQLDTLVRGLGGSRNNLRKGKMAYTISKGLPLPSLKRGFDHGSATPSLESIRSRSSRSFSKISDAKGEVVAETIPTGEAAFTSADKQLEICQNLCETAAHQFLRDGDCRLELNAAKANLESVLELAKPVHELFRLEAEQTEKVEESDSNGDSILTTSGSTLVEKPSRESINFSRKLAPTIINGESLKPRQQLLMPTITIPSSPPVQAAEIEVDDDSDQSSIEIDMSKYRAGNRARIHA